MYCPIVYPNSKHSYKPHSNNSSNTVLPSFKVLTEGLGLICDYSFTIAPSSNAPSNANSSHSSANRSAINSYVASRAPPPRCNCSIDKLITPTSTSDSINFSKLVSTTEKEIRSSQHLDDLLVGENNITANLLVLKSRYENIMSKSSDATVAFRKFVSETPSADLSEFTSKLSQLKTVMHDVASLSVGYAEEEALRSLTTSFTSDASSSPMVSSNATSETSSHQNFGCEKSATKVRKPKGSIKKPGRKPRGKYRPRVKVSQCSNCFVKDTPEWRRGPLGSKTVCNACGLFFSKLERKYGTEDAVIIFNHRAGTDVSNRVVPTEKERKSIVEQASSSSA